MVKHFAALTKPDELAEVLRCIESYCGTFVVQSALRLTPMLMVRPGELRHGMAWFRRAPAEGVVFHSDRRATLGHEFQSALAGCNIKSSMSRKGDCWDTAPTKSFWGRLKVGRLYGRKFATRMQAMDEIIDWMTFYNHRRIHSTLGCVSPMQFEKSWHAA